MSKNGLGIIVFTPGALRVARFKKLVWKGFFLTRDALRADRV